MTERARFRSLAWAAGLAALASCGCVAEWPWTVRPEGDTVAKGPPAPGAPATPPTPLVPAQPPDPAVTQLAADLQQNLAATRDQLKEQLARVHQLEVQLQEKEQTIQAMNHE